MKLFTKTFGCQMNFADSEEMSRHFFARGFGIVTSEENADAIVVNTCTVRDHAEHKAYSYIGRLLPWKESGTDRLLVVTGCAAERTKSQLKQRFPHIDLIVGAKDIELFPQELDLLLGNRILSEENLVPSQFTLVGAPNPSPVVQFVTIMRGCNYSCSYCIVPAVRGRERYRPVAEVLKEVEDRVKEGAKEIWFLGQTVNSYRPPHPPRPDYEFADLLRDANEIDGFDRLRFISPHPYYLNDKLIQSMAECDKVCQHMHLPVQSGSTTLLKQMRRNYTRDSYLTGVQKLRDAVPGIAITTDIIVGFPGETAEDFEQTLSLVQEADFEGAYCFKYSPRPGTLSAQWKEDVSEELKEQRLEKLLEMIDSRGQKKAQDLVGTNQEVLIEEELAPGVFRGKTRTSKKVRMFSSDLKLGQVITANIIGTHSRELQGNAVGLFGDAPLAASAQERSRIT